MAQSGSRLGQRRDRQNDRFRTQRENWRQRALVKARIGGIGEPFRLLVRRVFKRKANRQQHVAGGVYRGGEPLSRSLSASRSKACTQLVGALAGKCPGGGARRLAQIGRHRLVGFGEQQIERDDFRPGLTETFERLGEKSARQRPSTELAILRSSTRIIATSVPGGRTPRRRKRKSRDAVSSPRITGLSAKTVNKRTTIAAAASASPRRPRIPRRSLTAAPRPGLCAG